MYFAIREAWPDDRPGIYDVHRQAFGQDDEAKLVQALIEGHHAVLSIVAQQDEAIVGHILFSRLEIITDDGSVEPSTALAPVAVVPECQRRSLGSELIRRGLEDCRLRQEKSVFVLGDPAYYGRFGFSAELAARFESPYACEAFQAIELQPGALPAAGVVRYAPPFADLG